MLSEDSYLKSNFIIKNPYFADKNGNFDKDKFHDFYKDAATGWKQIQTKKNLEHVYDFFDPEAPEGAKKINPLTGNTKDLQTSASKPFGDFLKIVSYSDKIGTIGVGGFNAIEAPTKSAREEAQEQNIFDFSDKKTLNHPSINVYVVTYYPTTSRYKPPMPFLTVNLFLYLYILNEINLILCLTI